MGRGNGHPAGLLYRRELEARTKSSTDEAREFQ
jgi:hypothetical protein